jgi:hypothetical protein
MARLTDPASPPPRLRLGLIGRSTNATTTAEQSKAPTTIPAKKISLSE